MLAGLFPPKKTTLEWNKNLNWLPIHYKVVPFVDDILMLPHAAKPCPRYNQELKRVLREDFQSEIDDEADMLRELSIHSGWNITTPKLVRVLYSILNTEVMIQSYKYCTHINNIESYRKAMDWNYLNGPRNFIPKKCET